MVDGEVEEAIGAKVGRRLMLGDVALRGEGG